MIKQMIEHWRPLSCFALILLQAGCGVWVTVKLKASAAEEYPSDVNLDVALIWVGIGAITTFLTSLIAYGPTAVGVR